MNKTQMKEGITTFLKGLGIDLTDPHFIGTPNRIVRAYSGILAGAEQTKEKVEKILNTAFSSSSDQMIVIKNIHVFSMCPHHFLPVEYYISVAYIPNGRVLGLSKIPRLVETLAKRPIIQEDFTEDITRYLMTIDPLGAAARVVGQHLCMKMRGTKKPESIVITSSVLGAFREDASTRDEFLRQIEVGSF